MGVWLLASTLLVLSVFPQHGFAQPTRARVAVLGFRPLPNVVPPAFIGALKERGWIEGRNLTLTMRSTEGAGERSLQLAATTVKESPDVIVTFNYPNTKAVAAKTRAIPIVMLGVPNPVGLGLVASLSHPGGNITGVSPQTEDTLEKDLQLIKETRPGISRIAVVTYGAEPYWKVARDGYVAAARRVGLAIDAIPVRSAPDLDAALTKLTAAPPDALIVSSTPLFAVRAKAIAAFAIKHRLPTFTFQTQMTRDGLLMSYEADVPEMFRRLAAIVDKILRGAKPADIPVEQPTRFHFVVNLKTARAIGLQLPSLMIARADEVIE